MHIQCINCTRQCVSKILADERTSENNWCLMLWCQLFLDDVTANAELMLYHRHTYYVCIDDQGSNDCIKQAQEAGWCKLPGKVVWCVLHGIRFCTHLGPHPFIIVCIIAWWGYCWDSKDIRNKTSAHNCQDSWHNKRPLSSRGGMLARAPMDEPCAGDDGKAPSRTLGIVGSKISNGIGCGHQIQLQCRFQKGGEKMSAHIRSSVLDSSSSQNAVISKPIQSRQILKNSSSCQRVLDANRLHVYEVNERNTNM